jgi:protein-disulfide isomerase
VTWVVGSENLLILISRRSSMSTMKVARPARGWRSILDALASVAVIAAAGAVVWVNVVKPRLDRPTSTAVPIPSEPVSVSNLPTKGRPSAKVALIEYSDFECPFCARFVEEIQPFIQKEYVDTGRAVVVFRHLPLQQIHPFAETAARGAVSAAEQGILGNARRALRDERRSRTDHI